MRQIVVPIQSETPKITPLPTGSYHVLAKDGEDFQIEDLDLLLNFDARASFISVMMVDYNQSADIEDYEVCSRDVEGEPETSVFEILIPRPRLDMALEIRKSHLPE